MKKNIILLGAGMIIEACVSINYAFSVFQNPLIHKFGWSPSTVSLAFTIAMIMFIVSPITGKLQEFFTQRQIILVGSFIYGIGLIATGFISSLFLLYLFYGLIAGLGAMLIFPLVLSYLVQVFPKRKGLVSGLLAASFGAGSIVWAPVGVALTEAYGVSNAFIILGIGLMTIIAGCSFLFENKKITKNDMREIKNEHAVEVKQQSVKDKTWKEMLRTFEFYTIYFMFIIGLSAGLMIQGHASPIVQNMLKMDPYEAALIVSLLSASTTLGKIFWGTISDIIGRFQIIVLLFSFIIISMFALSTGVNHYFIIAALAIIQFCFGGFSAFIAPLTSDLFGNAHMPINYGIMFTSFAFGGIFGPRIAASIIEFSDGSYDKAFIIAGILSLIGLLLVIITVIKNRYKKENTARVQV